MVRCRRVVKRPKASKIVEYDSDDPACYKNEEIPDKRSFQTVQDKTDNLLFQGVQQNSEQEDEEEVMPLTLEYSDDDDDEEEEEDKNNEEKDETDMESDLEGKGDDDLPNVMAWGSKKKMYYDSEYTGKKGKPLDEVEAEDKEEEEEARNIQKRLAANLSEEDYDLNILQEFALDVEAEKTAEKSRTIVKDLNAISQKEKLKLLKKDSPELLELIQDFKAKVIELRDKIQPSVQRVKDGQIPPGKGANYLMIKQQLYLNYCTNICFYLLLKAKRIPVHNHPMIERLVTYRNLISKLEAVDARLSSQLHQLLSESLNEKSAQSSKTAKSEVTKMADLQEAEESDSDEDTALMFYKGIEENLRLKRMNKRLAEDGLMMEHEESEEEAEIDGDAKRGITYQMTKNKGLTPKRKKIDRNPRVKHREKFRRAKIRRKGQALEVRNEEKRYSGELSGIRAGVKKSIKLK